ncbi:unnamed protein product [Effrenium voratum]|nr:unnamed protein product [Effrenium voratum]
MGPLNFQGRRCFSLLAQLPDFAAGEQALKEGRYADALPMLQRSVEVADAYFPPDAGAERAQCHKALGSCLWHQGHFDEAARAWTLSDGALHLAAARAHFELGNFEQVAKLTSDAAVLGAVCAVRGEEVPEVQGPLAVIAQVNRLVKEAVIGAEGASDVPEPTAASLLEAEASAELRLLLRCTLGELAVLAGQKDDWLRECLVKCLKDYDALEPKDPVQQAVVVRSLTALATLTNARGDAITAEGLFRSAQDQARAKLPTGGSGGRRRLWARQVPEAFARMLETGRHAEQRAPEIRDLRAEAAQLSPGEATAAERRWGLVVLPQVEE